MQKPFVQSNLHGVAFALAAFGLYATHDAVLKVLAVNFSVFQVVFYLNLFTLPMVVAMLMADPALGNLRPKHPWWILLRSILSVVGSISVFYAFTVLKMSETYAILFTTPLFITALSVPVLGEHVGPRRWGAVLIGFAGVLIVLNPGVSEIGLAHLAALLGAASAALIFVSVRKIGRDERVSVLMLYPMLTNLILMAGLAALTYRPMPLNDLALNGFMAVLGFIAMLCLIHAYRVATAVTVAPMQYSQMLWAIFFGFLLFDETLEVRVLLGAGVIIASGLYIALRERKVLGDIPTSEIAKY